MVDRLITVGRQGPPGPPMRAVSTPGDLTSRGASFGVGAYVQALRDPWWFVPDAAEAPDGITRVQGVGGQWVRGVGNPQAWEAQTAWGINADTGSDLNVGSVESPIASHAELRRRIGRLDVIRRPYVVNILSDLAEDLDTRWASDGAGNYVRYRGGVAEVLYEGTLTGLQAQDPANNLEPRIEDAAIDWNTAGPGGTTLIGHHVEITNGAQAGARGWLLKRLSASTARTSRFCTFTAPGTVTGVTLSGTPTYRVVRYRSIRALNAMAWRFRSQSPTLAGAVLEELSITGGGASLQVSCQAQSTRDTWFIWCRFEQFTTFWGGSVTLNGCLGNQALQVLNECRASISNCGIRGLSGAVLNVSNGAWTDLLELVATDGELRAFRGGRIAISSPACVYDSTGNGVVVRAGSQVLLSSGGRLYGSGNVQRGVLCEGLLSYTVKPTITGNAGDTTVGGTARTWPEIPHFNGNNGAAIIDLGTL
jgi:hypothetical protein